MPPPAENPMMPTRAASMRQAAAFGRARRSACCASAMPICNTSRSAGSSGSGLALPLRISSSFRGAAPAAARPGGGAPRPRPLAGIVCSVRYLSTSAATPLLFNHCATMPPTLSQPSSRSAPPGATTTAFPVAFPASGRNTVTVGSLTLVIVRSPVGEVVVTSGMAQASEPGALPGHSRISCGACATALLAIASSPILITARIKSIDTVALPPLTVEELENPRPHHRHHASVVTIDFEVLEREAALAHVSRQHAAAFERRRRAGPLGHEDRQSLDPIERIRRLVYEGPRHRRDRAPPFGIPGGKVPRPATAHRVAGKIRARAIGTVFLGHDLQRGDDLEFTEIELALTGRRDGSPLRGGCRRLAEDRRQPKGIAIGAE